AKYKNNDEVAKYISSNNVNTLIDFKGSDKELLSANIPVSSVDTDKSFAQKYKSLKFSKNITLDLLDLNNNSVLLSYNSRKKIYPASTTKIMTALLAIESGKLDDVVTVKASETKFAWDEQVIGFKAGDKVTIRELLKGLIVYSGNDAAVIIADHLAGSVPAFSEKMNARAKELGAFNTHFINPNGIHNPNHYTTAYDLCLIFNQCIKHEEFLNLVKLKNTRISFKDKKGKVQALDFHSTNYYLTGKAEFPTNLTIVGGKTGTTKAAGACLILLVKDKNGNNYISIVMDSKDHETLYQDMTKLLGCIKGD
ncbi:MAG: serine hydrolase, partial [Lachnospiraceae bacterium]|nr:serine hydrolase [Lachnospiraceae bacterium]